MYWMNKNEYLPIIMQNISSNKASGLRALTGASQA